MVANPSHAQPFQHFDQLPVADGWRHTRRNPCPICGGGEGDRRGRGVRCYGKTFTSADGRQWSICTREDFAGALAKNERSGGYTHLSAGGRCNCGEEHSASADSAPRSPRPERLEPTPAKVTRAHKSEPPTALYAYHALETGAPLRKLRYGSGKGKRFVWQRADGSGDWLDCKGDRPTPNAYRAETLEGADPFEPLAITEGEKDADGVARLGWRLVISPPDGVGSWDDAYNVHARGRQVVIFADKDADGKGQTHAERIADALLSVAASVRIVLFDEAHDVGDWLDAGHTFAELRAIAAATPIITARTLSALNDSFTSQDGLSKIDPKSCPNCQRLEDRARVAETSLANLRRERAAEDRYLAMPNETLSAPAKLAALALRRELNDKPHNERDADGRPRIYRAAIAQRIGLKESSAGANLQKVAEAGLFQRWEKRSRDDTATFYAPGPHFDQPETVAAPERANTWGGKRVKLCSACGSENLETRTVCRDCGALVEHHDTNKPDAQEPSEEARSLNDSFTSQDGLSKETAPQEHSSDHTAHPHTQEEGQEYFPPLSILVSNLALSGDPRTDVLRLAEALGWPRLPLARPFAHIAVPAGDFAWHSFIRGASTDQLRAALAALEPCVA